MAGLLKPNGVKPEGKWTINGSVLYYTTCNLFDGLSNTGIFDYWSSAGNYVDITLNQVTNIWACPHDSYLTSYTTLFAIQQYVNGSWVNITPIQNSRPTTLKTWGIIFPALPKGRYKIMTGTSSRIDGEWYIECADIIKSLLRTSLPDEIYTSVNGKLTSIPTIDPLALTQIDFETHGMLELDCILDPFNSISLVTENDGTLNGDYLWKKTITTDEYTVKRIEVK